MLWREIREESGIFRVEMSFNEAQSWDDYTKLCTSQSRDTQCRRNPKIGVCPFHILPLRLEERSNCFNTPINPPSCSKNRIWNKHAAIILPHNFLAHASRKHEHQECRRIQSKIWRWFFQPGDDWPWNSEENMTKGLRIAKMGAGLRNRRSGMGLWRLRNGAGLRRRKNRMRLRLNGRKVLGRIAYWQGHGQMMKES
jgi:hypothetical protein